MEDRELGRRIAYWRRRRGLTQVIFADRIGRSRSWVVKIEAGQRSAAKLSVLDIICDVLAVDLSTLIGKEPNRQAEICLDDTEVARIRAALERYCLATDNIEPDLAALRRQVAHAWTAFEFADYDVVSLVLPSLLEKAQAAQTLLNDRPSSLLLIETYQIAASTLRKLGEHSLAWLAGDRGISLARQFGDSASITATGFRIANALLSMGRARQAWELGVALAETMSADVHDESRRALYGHVLLQTAIAAATVGNSSSVRDLIAEAHQTARFVSNSADYYRLAFSATNVSLHEVSALIALGEGGRAIEVANAIDERNLVMLRKERRAALLVDVARAYSHVGKRDAALSTLLEAEAIASREVRCRPVAQATIADLIRRAQLSSPLALTRLAERAGVPA